MPNATDEAGIGQTHRAERHGVSRDQRARRESVARTTLECTVSRCPASSRPLLGGASLVGGIGSPRRGDGALDERRLALGRGSHATKVPRLDADPAQRDERAQHAERLVAVVLGRGQQRGRDRVVEQGRGRAGVGDELVAPKALGAPRNAAALVAPGSAGVSPASIASRCVRMTLSGR